MPEFRENSHDEIRVFEKTLEFNKSTIVFTDPKGNITYANPAFVRRTGYSLDEVVGKNPRILKSGRQGEKVYRELWNTINAGGTWTGQLQNKCKDGSLLWEQATIFPVFDENSEISQFVAIKDDITTERRSQAILRCVGEANQLLLRASDLKLATPGILRLLGESCEVERTYLFEYREPISSPNEGEISMVSEWNSGECESQNNDPDLQGISVQTGLFRSWIDTMKIGEVVKSNVSDLPEQERQFMEQRSIVSLLRIPVHTGRKLYGFLGFDDCHTERDWPEQEIALLQSVAGNLGIVLQRKDYEKDIQEALIKAESSAIEAIQASTVKSEFLATISHEIRTPLNGILGMTQIMLDEETSEEKKDFIETIYRCGENLDQLLNDILDFSKIEAGKLGIIKRDFSLEDSAREVCQIFRPMAEKSRLDLSLHFSPDIPKPFHSDPHKFRQILSNLISNALKFTEKGEIEIRVSRSSEIPVGVLIQVSDTGIGIHPSFVEDLFDMFTQADSSSTRRYGGTGLGLAICRRFAEALGGRIWFENSPAGGSRFSVELPSLSSQSQDHSEATVSNANSPEQSKPKVLVVEDNPVNLRVTKLQLQSLGYSCVGVDGGKEAIELFENGVSFDIVLMDCQMQGLNGFETAEEILSFATPPPYIVAFTASTLEIDKKRAFDVGMKEYLMKPVTKERIKTAIEGYFQNRA